MGYWILNLGDGDHDQAAARLQGGRWPLAPDERHAGRARPGDVALIHVGLPRCAFVGHAVVAGGWDAGVSLTAGQQWTKAVPLAAAVQRIDPHGANPIVQGNAAGFARGLVEITASEYEAVMQLARS